MLNSERFLNAYAAIEKHLRRLAGGDRSATFSQVLEKAVASDWAARCWKDDLREYHDLRNAIVHERTDGHVIAEPNDGAVADLKHIAAQLTQPPSVIPSFQTQVASFGSQDAIAAAVSTMWEESFSQVAVVDSGVFSGLLTTNTIARWLGANVADDLFSLRETPISRVMKYTEDHENHAFLSRNASVYEALHKFAQPESAGRRLDAILITQHGKRDESILGIITISDLPKVYGLVGRQ